MSFSYSASVRLLTLLVITSSAIGMKAQDPAVGDWKGTLETPRAQLPIRFHIEEDGKGFVGTMDSPDQGVEGLELDTVVRKEDSLRISIDRASASYEGVFVGADSLSGKWEQRGFAYELDLGRGSDSSGIRRPQTPRPPYPYASIDTNFEQASEGFRMGGTVTIPNGDGPFPGVVLVSGSGPQDRDETIVQHKPFRVIADRLTKSGFAVLRYDDRGVAESEGTFQGSTIREFEEDARSALDFLKGFDRVDPERVGMLGHSEGGMVVSRVAAASGSDPAFLVLLASPALRGDSTMITQERAIRSEMGVPKDVIKARLRILDSMTTYIRKGRDTNAIEQKLGELVEQEFGEFLDSSRQEDIQKQFLANARSAWFRSFLRDDPMEAYRKTSLPVLALFGENDLQVLAEPNVKKMKKGLSNNEGSEVRIIEGVNHLFQPDRSGVPSGYGRIETTIHPPVLDVIEEWMDKTVEADR